MKNIKKIVAALLLIASMIACVAGLTACGGEVSGECVEHQWGEWGIIISEKCPDPENPGANDGYRVRVCQVCKESMGEKIPESHRFVDGVCQACGKKECTSHSFGQWTVTKVANCTENGSQTRTCTVCGDVEIQSITAIGHNFVNGVCSREGCGVIDCDEHVFGEWTTVSNATCTQNGKRERICTVCNEKEIEILYASEHNYEDGECTVCGKPDPSVSGGNKELDPNCSHKDANNDDTCDLCNGYVIVVIDIYAINDLHGKLFDTDSQPGVDELTTYIKNAYVTDENVIVLSSGDMWQGTSESNLTHGNMMTEWLNELGTVSMTLGNHEFDWNNSYIYENLDLATFSFLAINIYDTNTNTRATFATPSVVVERGGAKIGIIGAIGDCYSSISQDKVNGIEFKVGSALTSLVKAESERLRALGCDMIVYSIHDGLDSGEGYGEVSSSTFSRYYDTMLSNGYVDVVFEAHSHQRYVCTDSYGVYHLQGGGENSGISHVELSLNVITDKVNVGTAENVSSYVYESCTPDEIVNALREKYKNEIAKGEELLGYVQNYTNGDTLRQICADMYLSYGLELWGDKYNIVLGGGYIGIRSPYNLYSGDAYYKDIYSLFPFDNALCLCAVSGYKLRRQFINSTNDNYFIAMSDYGRGIQNSINDSETYYIIVDTYSAFYSYNGCTIIEMLDEEFFARDMIAEYIKDGGLGKKPENPGTSGSVDISKYDIKTVAEIKEIIDDIVEKYGVNVDSTLEYYMLVTITDTPQATYGNCNVMDETGEIFIYGIKDERGTLLYKNLPTKPKEGDTILVCGTLLYYYNPTTGEMKYEMKNAKLIAINPTDAD